MRRVTERFECPACEETLFYRVHRNWWMRMIPGSRNYMCASCHRQLFVRKPPQDDSQKKIAVRVPHQDASLPS